MSKLKWCLCVVAVIALAIGLRSIGADEKPSVLDGDKNKPPAGTQAMRSFPVTVVSEDGSPIQNVLITPWALRCGQGHDWWQDDDKLAQVGPQEVRTDNEGKALVAYPYYRDVKEAIRTIEVSIKVAHANYALPDAFHVEVPLADSPYEIRLSKGAVAQLRPIIDGQPTDTAQVYAMWSDNRSHDPNIQLEQTSASTLRLPPMLRESQSILVGKFDGERLAYLSSIINFDAGSQDKQIMDVPLKPIKQIKGMLDANVPRPIVNGRIQARTIPLPDTKSSEVAWMNWAKVDGDGSFTIDAWPQDEAIQIIALCEGFVGASGDKPKEVNHPFDKATDPFQRPQCFAADVTQITIAMEPLVRCEVTAVDENQKPLAGLQVASWPNVGWWNVGSQIYCDPQTLFRSEELLRTRKYQLNSENGFNPFEGLTDEHGQTVLSIPQGKERIAVLSNDYEMPVNLGYRESMIQLEIGKTAHVDLQLQSKGTERLGDWDKLAGVVFGCSTREGRQICALPEVRAKMDEFRTKFQDAKNRKDPKLLAEAYTVVAQAFANAKDLDESLKWQARADEQAAKAAPQESK